MEALFYVTLTGISLFFAKLLLWEFWENVKANRRVRKLRLSSTSLPSHGPTFSKESLALISEDKRNGR